MKSTKSTGRERFCRLRRLRLKKTNERRSNKQGEFGRGFTPTNLKYMRLFYLAYPHLLSNEKRHAVSDQSAIVTVSPKMVVTLVDTPNDSKLSARRTV